MAADIVRILALSLPVIAAFVERELRKGSKPEEIAARVEDLLAEKGATERALEELGPP